jgi:soluble lytic murein transglycosylase-like protein
MIPAVPPPEVQPVTLECVVEVSRRYQLPLDLLAGVLAQEHGRLGDKLPRRDGSHDYGPMQVNSYWLPWLARHGISEHQLRWWGCYNVAVGGWILRYEMGRARGDVWRAVGRYNTPKPQLQGAFIENVRGKMRALAAGTLTLPDLVRYANGGRK